jgi:hypothetical protein
VIVEGKWRIEQYDGLIAADRFEHRRDQRPIGVGVRKAVAEVEPRRRRGSRANGP